MAREGSGRAGYLGRAGARGGGRWRPPTWEVSDSDGEGPAGAEAGATARGPVKERRAAAEERRAAAEALRPEQALRRVAVRVDAALLEDTGADILLEALRALGCEYHIEPQRPARSLRWTRAKPDPCPRTVPSEVWAADEQDLLLLLEPEEFLQGVQQLTQVSPAQQPGDATARESSGGPCHSGTQLAQGGGGPGTPAALGTSGCTAGGLLARAESACVCLHQSPRSTPLQAVPGVLCLFLLCGWALGSQRARGERWQRVAGHLVAADQTVPPGQPGCGRCHCHRLPLPPPSAAGIHEMQHGAGAPGPPGRPPREDGRWRAASQGGA
ncbi:probable crossover junction endonuclease EME2 isoform X3 [Zalophus californianus]|uniref:Probable crossover junction endonuclease EME2 isoform X3 n=1 Tax=Zalophus californianus TaxID=9704 RepID=A0A6J2ELU2_ZALCA|nr:probable crossover junction endonuclease EME2 isoform X3 [Zalophus californianus]